MAGELRQVELEPRLLVEKLNHLEYVVGKIKKEVAPLKKGPLKDQTADFLQLMETVEDAIGTYRDELADLAEAE